MKRLAQAIPEYLFTIALLLVFLGVVAKILFDTKAGIIKGGGDVLDTAQNISYEGLNSTAGEG
jgi:hypothetical protein